MIVKRVFAVARHHEADDGIGLEPIVVIIGQFFAAGIVNRQDRLEPARDSVGDVRDQLPRRRGQHQALALARVEAITVHSPEAIWPLTVQGRVIRCSASSSGRLRSASSSLPQHLDRGREHRLAHDLGNLANVERSGFDTPRGVTSRSSRGPEGRLAPG